MYTMKKILILIFSFLIYNISFSQNNYIVKTEDGRRVLLKADFTWEYIDLITPKKDTVVTQKIAPKKSEIATTPIKNNASSNCDLGFGFSEPQLNTKIQSFLKRGRATISHLKKKVAKKYKCDVNDIILISARESKQLGSYTLCANGIRVSYKRNQFTYIKKNKLF